MRRTLNMFPSERRDTTRTALLRNSLEETQRQTSIKDRNLLFTIAAAAAAAVAAVTATACSEPTQPQVTIPVIDNPEPTVATLPGMTPATLDTVATNIPLPDQADTWTATPPVDPGAALVAAATTLGVTGPVETIDSMTGITNPTGPFIDVQGPWNAWFHRIDNPDTCTICTPDGPIEEHALTYARKLLALQPAELQTVADLTTRTVTTDDTTSVAVHLVLDDTTSALNYTFTYTNRQLTYVAGFTGTPTRSTRVDVVDIDTVLTRLTGRTPINAPGTVYTGATITRVEPALEDIATSDGSGLLVPAYYMTDTEGNLYLVPAVADGTFTS